MVIRRFLACKSPMYMFAAARHSACGPPRVTASPQHSGTRNAARLVADFYRRTHTLYSLRTENRIGRTAKLINVPQTIDAIYRLFCCCCCSFLPLERVRGLPLSYPWTNHVWRGADNLTDAVDRFGALCPPRGEREMSACREEFSRWKRPCCSSAFFACTQK
jgi:hypothetical protein